LIAVTSPGELGLEQSRTKVGGDSLSQTDALVVVDFPEVLERIEQVVTEIDVPPSQVVIEAMILSVKLTDSMKMGVNFALLNGTTRQLATSGNGSIINSTPGFPGPGKTSILPAAGEFLAQTAGLKYGFIQGDISGFIDALETLTDTSVVAAPSLRVLNKQRAELIIGERLGYKTSTFNGTQTIENINFLEVGTKLLLRPWVAEDGLVRMEIHPERSDGQVTDGLPSSRTTEVTSNVMVRDGTTIVIGGLIEEQANQSQFRIPGLGALPVVGNLFKSKASDSTRTELIVLITPRVVPALETEYEGSVLQVENERRHEEFRNRQSSINRRSLSRIEYEKAARDFEEGHLSRAKYHIEESLRHNRNDVQALRLRNTIDACNTEQSGWFHWPVKFRRKPEEQYHRIGSEPSATLEPLEIPASTPYSP
jgi:type IV pilus assembly protein PilQ